MGRHSPGPEHQAPGNWVSATTLVRLYQSERDATAAVRFCDCPILTVGGYPAEHRSGCDWMRSRLDIRRPV